MGNLPTTCSACPQILQQWMTTPALADDDANITTTNTTKSEVTPPMVQMLATGTTCDSEERAKVEDYMWFIQNNFPMTQEDIDRERYEASGVYDYTPLPKPVTHEVMGHKVTYTHALKRKDLSNPQGVVPDSVCTCCHDPDELPTLDEGSDEECYGEAKPGKLLCYECGKTVLYDNQWCPNCDQTQAEGDWFCEFCARHLNGKAQWRNHVRILQHKHNRIGQMRIWLKNGMDEMVYPSEKVYKPERDPHNSKVKKDSYPKEKEESDSDEETDEDMPPLMPVEKERVTLLKKIFQHDEEHGMMEHIAQDHPPIILFVPPSYGKSTWIKDKANRHLLQHDQDWLLLNTRNQPISDKPCIHKDTRHYYTQKDKKYGWETWNCMCLKELLR